MILELSKGKILKEAFKSISRIIDEAVIECDSEGFRLKAMDRSHITFVEMDLKSELFDEYNCDVPEKISIDTMDFFNILRRMKNNDVLKLETDDEIILTFTGESVRTFKLRLISLDYETPTPPSLDLPVSVNLPCKVLEDVLKDVDLYSDKIKFLVDGDYLRCIGEGETGECETKYIHGESVDSVVNSVFSLMKIEDMVKSSSLSKNCILNLGNDTPMELIFPFDNGYIKYLLAPRLEEE